MAVGRTLPTAILITAIATMAVTAGTIGTVATRAIVMLGTTPFIITIDDWLQIRL
jgi:hypothetical protein